MLGQGYFTFAATKNIVFLNINGLVPANAEVDVAFLWGFASTPAIITAAGAGNVGSPTSAVETGANWLTVLQDESFSWATNASTGQLAVQTCNGAGGWNYNGGFSFPVAGTPNGGTVQVYVVAWPTYGGTLTNPWQAAVQGTLFGWSNVFSYSPGQSSNSTVVPFIPAGIKPFGITVPEPSLITLATLGGIGLAFLRQRKRL